jgi:phage/plasmid primase-like uncharacterized protein
MDAKSQNNPFAGPFENYEFEFAQALEAEGYGFHLIPADGEWHDFGMPDQRRGRKSGAAKLTLDRDGVVIDRRKGNAPIFVWRGNGAELTPEQREALAQQNAERAADIKRRQDAARKKVAESYPKYPDATSDHWYLKAKGITNTVPLKLSDQTWLVIPMFNAATGELQTLQSIGPAGQKQFMVDGVTTGACVLPGHYGLDALNQSSDPIVIAEGYATAEAVNRSTGWPALAAMSCGNLKPVAEAMRQRFPNRAIILAADHDESGAGLEAANNAANAVGGTVAIPAKVGTDFSDLLLSDGEEAVAAIVRAAVPPKESKTGLLIKPTPFEYIEPHKIPPRRWLYRPYYVRGVASLTVAPGAVGKTSLLMPEALSMVTRRDLLGVQPEEGPLRVWYWNGEEPFEELQRRLAAAYKHYGISKADIGDRLFLDSGHILPIVLAKQIKSETQIAIPVVNAVVEALREYKIDVLMIDPFISTHQISENDNMAMDQVAKTWARIAVEVKCSLMLAHHSRKTQGNGDVSIEDSRGAIALVNAVRSGRVLNMMNIGEAEAIGLTRYQRRSYFRIDSDLGKANMVQAAEDATWFKLISVDLENNPFGSDDEVGVVTQWQYPMATKPEFTNADIRRAQDRIDQGTWRLDQRAQSHPWVGVPIAEVFGINLDIEQNKKRMVKLINDWRIKGYLRVEDRPDASRRERTFVLVGDRPPIDPGEQF